MAGAGRGDGRGEGVGRADVGLDRVGVRSELLGQRPEVLTARQGVGHRRVVPTGVHEHRPPALGREAAGGGRADAAGSARDERDPGQVLNPAR